MKQFPFEYMCPHCGELTSLKLTPSRPAPACSNPSSPAYSDSGDPGEVEGPDNCLNCGREFDLDKVIEMGEIEFGKSETDRIQDYADPDPSNQDLI